MRQLLDRLYAVSGAIAALFIVAICAIVLLQVGFNLVDRIAQLVTGRAIGLVVPSYAEFAGFFLAAASFFALADTLSSGNHIRVNLVIQRVPERQRPLIEAWSCLLGALVSGYFTFWAGNLVWESFEFGDLSPGIIAVPLWLPQLSMALGLLCLTICFIDLFVQVCRGEQPSYRTHEETLAGEE
ncbi:MAG: TRAP transporter small permease subunit [Pseudomonadota bacterium]